MFERKSLCIKLLSLLYLTALAQGYPFREAEDTPNGLVNGAGKNVIDKFDQVFYGLLDEAAQYVTDDRKGAFKDMLIRHRSDLMNNIRENLVNRDKITLNDVKETLVREIQNRLELFNYVGSGVWNKLKNWSEKMYGQYRTYCGENSTSVWCVTGRSDKSRSKPDDLEREFA